MVHFFFAAIIIISIIIVITLQLTLAIRGTTERNVPSRHIQFVRLSELNDQTLRATRFNKTKPRW